MPVTDADAHVVEPNDLWVRRLDERWRARAPRVVSASGGAAAPDRAALLELLTVATGAGREALDATLSGERVGFRDLQVDAQTVWEGVPDGLWARGAAETLRHHPRSALAGFDAGSHAAALRAMGFDRAHLFPTVGLWLFAIDGMEPAFAAALVRAYNEWLRDFCAADDLFRPVGALCRHDPVEMVAELRRVAGWGWRAVTLRPNVMAGRSLSAPEHEPFWSECERLGVAVALHEGTHARVPAAGRERFTTRFARHACSHPLEQMMALLSLIEGGVLERHPALRVGFMESGAGWLPYWLSRLDGEYRQLGWEVSENVRMKPSDYVRRQCYVSCDPGEPGLEDVLDLLGEDRLLFGSDFPHVDHDPDVRAALRRLEERLTPRVAHRVLDHNPGAFYGEI
jgi:predicted TIM-barrel fold metal-dependent hydrolase